MNTSVNDAGSVLTVGVMGMAVGLLAGAAMTILIALYLRRRRTRALSRAAAVYPASSLAPVEAVRQTQKIDDAAASVVSVQTLEALRQGKEIYELERQQLTEVLDEAGSVGLDEIGDDTLRRKIVRCTLGPGITRLLPAQADVLWGCVLSWDPMERDLEKQTTDVFSVACRDYGAFDSAMPIHEHSRHMIPVPEQIEMNSNMLLIFDRSLNTLLDEGASASVFRAHTKGGRDVAVKISRLSDYGILRNTLLEYMMLRRAQGIDAVIKLYGAGCYHVGDEVFFFIVEEIAETTLSGEYELRKAAKTPFREKELRERIVKPFLESLVKLHERGIIHRDLKPRNIYLVDGVFKIGDFEIAAFSRDESRRVLSRTFAGSPAYSTAGALVGRYGPDTDINALACICHMMLRGDLPAMEDAPGTSTLVRGIRDGETMSQDDKLRQEKAKKAVQEWLTQKKGFVAQIRKSLRSTPFERFFIAPIIAQGSYAEATEGAIMTAGEALKTLARIELSEEAQEVRKKALELAGGGDYESARKTLVDFDARFNGRSHADIEVSMHVMIGETLKEIDRLEDRHAPPTISSFDGRKETPVR